MSVCWNSNIYCWEEWCVRDKEWGVLSVCWCVLYCISQVRLCSTVILSIESDVLKKLTFDNAISRTASRKSWKWIEIKVYFKSTVYTFIFYISNNIKSMFFDSETLSFLITLVKDGVQTRLYSSSWNLMFLISFCSIYNGTREISY